MKRNILLITIAVALATMLAAFSGNKPKIMTNPNQQKGAYDTLKYEKLWNEAEKLIDKGLPKSAAEKVEKIYNMARDEHNPPMYIKAVLFKMKILSDYEEEYLNKIIGDLGNEIEYTAFPETSILHSILASIYWDYYQQNRYKFMERSQVSEVDEADIETWDLRHIMEKIKDHFLASLENSDELKKLSIEKFTSILLQAENSEVFRPTLYDFLAHRALEFFMHDDNELTRPAFVFQVNDVQYFDPAEKFIKMKLKSQDTSALKYKAILILQELIAFHLQDDNPDALVDIDLHRLAFVHENIVGIAQPDQAYLEALQHLKSNYSDHAISTRVTYQMALLHEKLGNQYDPHEAPQYQWELKKAVDLCDEAIGSFSASIGANNCKVVKSRIEQTRLSLSTAGVELPGKPILALLSFRNTERANIRFIKTNYEAHRELQRNNRSEKLIKAYLNYKNYAQKSFELINKGDFQTHSAQVVLPPLEPGFYVFLIGHEGLADEDQIPDALGTIMVSDLSYISNRKGNGDYEFFVLNRNSGEALKDIQCRVYKQEYDYRTSKYVHKDFIDLESDKQGYLLVRRTNVDRNFSIQLIHKKDTLQSNEVFYAYPERGKDEPQTRTFFFTDRAIYRPGQTLYFKGIMLEKQDDDKYEIMPGENTEVTFYDVNKQEISSLKLKSNEYGSFHGSFTTPTGVLTGQMSIKNESGTNWFNVEEYKRPRFKVTFNPVSGTYKLNEKLSITGEAKAYAGNPVDDAVVKYRVVRNVRMPYWRWWWGLPPFGGAETEIINGYTQTNDQGLFEIDFTALPDLSIKTAYEPVFTFTVYADVTDINGETRSGSTSLSVGEKALILKTKLNENVNREKTKSLQIHATNPNGEKIDASGEINIYKLNPPERIFRKRLWQRPDVFVMAKENFYRDFPHDLFDNENDPATWARSQALLNKSFYTGKKAEIKLENMQDWETGMYLLEMKSKDAFGQDVQVKEYFTLYSPVSDDVPANEIIWFQSMEENAEVGEKLNILAGSAAKGVHALYELKYKKGKHSSQWLNLDKEQSKITEDILPDYRGNFGIGIAFVKFNRFYSAEQTITVPYSNKILDVQLETFRDKLKPGEKEEWKIKITGPGGDAVAAEMLASMYDASLDAFVGHNWGFHLYHSQSFRLGWQSGNNFYAAHSRYFPETGIADRIIRQEYDRLNWFGFHRWAPVHYQKSMMMRDASAGMQEDEMMPEVIATKQEDENIIPEKQDKKESAPPLQIRKDFRETVFFYPDMMTNEKGEIILKFNMPDALTRWKFMGLAYTKDLKTGQLQKELVTQKQLMLMPNAPRYFREGDTMYFSAKISSLLDEKLQGTARLELFNSLSMQKINDLLQVEAEEIPFELDEKSSTSVRWRIVIPQGLEAITYRIKAHTDKFSDGEEMAIPVLPNRMLVTESLPLPVRAGQSKDFRFEKLIKSGESKTLDNYWLTLEYTSNPAWYAVQALPYLMEYPYECSEQVFSRYYANSLATFIANSNPRIKQVFDAWRDLSPDALLSNLEKNQELKSVLLEETPWVRQAKNETERKKRIALLFDLNKMSYELKHAIKKLQLMQLSSGAWPWFTGMRENRYITQYIITGLAHLNHLGVIDIDENIQLGSMVENGLRYLDGQIHQYLKELERKEVDLQADHISHLQIQYLYMRSYLVDDFKIRNKNLEAFNYYKGQADKYWLNKDLYMQGMIALALNRFGFKSTPSNIIASLKEKSLHSEEMGMYWRRNNGWYWYQAPIERQALLIEAFEEVSNDQKAVEEMKVWLLKQKQTQDWKTTKATAKAIYALLLRGTDLLADDDLVEISIGGHVIEPEKDVSTDIEAGTGYFKKTWNAEEIEADMGKVEVNNPNDHIAWGALYWQYFEDLDKITPHESPLSIEKDLFLEKNTDRGPVIEPIDQASSLTVGDKVMVRIIIRVDRDMEYVHLKDMRAAAFEPVNVLSGYRWQSGLGYYESIRDASTNFFIDYLPKGTYVFEYPLMSSQEGDFSNGITSIQCMYAPEFGSHSEGMRVRVR
ncbi:MAG: hypothetical protein K9G58_04975 [Bacteroidales bacterium]|nr:hypothetical protein [Bacteroidales bacterium]MCF8397499.1 hypothetical protein [Bacteroidales bacterium]